MCRLSAYGAGRSSGPRAGGWLCWSGAPRPAQPRGRTPFVAARSRKSFLRGWPSPRGMHYFAGCHRVMAARRGRRRQRPMRPRLLGRRCCGSRPGEFAVNAGEKLSSADKDRLGEMDYLLLRPRGAAPAHPARKSSSPTRNSRPRGDILGAQWQRCRIDHARMTWITWILRHLWTPRISTVRSVRESVEPGVLTVLLDDRPQVFAKCCHDLIRIVIPWCPSHECPVAIEHAPPRLESDPATVGVE